MVEQRRALPPIERYQGCRQCEDGLLTRSGADPILSELADGLKGEAYSIQIVGHTSSEGSDAYNLDLSKRRAQAVGNAIAAKGPDAWKLSAVGKSEADPIAPNTDEACRSIKRRVEIKCSE